MVTHETPDSVLDKQWDHLVGMRPERDRVTGVDDHVALRRAQRVEHSPCRREVRVGVCDDSYALHLEEVMVPATHVEHRPIAARLSRLRRVRVAQARNPGSPFTTKGGAGSLRRSIALRWEP